MRSFPVVALLLVAAVTCSEAGTLDLLDAAPHVPPLHGAILARAWSDTSLGTARTSRVLESLSRDRATAVAFDVVATVSGADRPFVDASSAEDPLEFARLSRTVVEARRIGLRPVLRLHLDRLDGGPRARIAMTDQRAWELFFRDLGRWVEVWAVHAQDLGVDLLVLPSGLSGTTHREADWRRLIAGVRARYRGALTYGARSDDEVQRLRFWDEFDVIGVEWVESVERPGDLDPTPRPRPSVWSASDEDSVAVAEIAAALAPRVDALRAVAAEFRRPVLVTSAGFRSVPQAWRRVEEPIGRFDPPDERDQARAIAGTLRAWDRGGAADWMRGALWREIDLIDLDASAEARRTWSRSHSVRGKRGLEPLVDAWARSDAAPFVVGAGGAVVTSDSTATRVAVEILREGGTAVDAAVAAAFVLTVVRPDAAGLGGGGTGVLYDHRARAGFVLDFVPRAPLAADAFLFERLEAQGLTEGARRGALVAGIPGTVPGLHALWERAGGLEWRRVLRPALELAARGSAVTPALAEQLAAHRARLNGFASTREVFLPGGRLLQPGDPLARPRQAEALLQVAAEGGRAGAHGRVAAARVDAIARAGGLWTPDDLATYRPRWERAARLPLTPDGRVELHTTPSSSIDGFAGTRSGSPLGAQDRASPPAPREGRPDPSATRPLRTLHAVHVAVIDARGDAVSLVLTLHGPFGGGWIDPETGELLNDALLDFDLDTARPDFDPTHPDVLRPGAAPRVDLTPAVVGADRQSWFVVGGAAGAEAVARTVYARVVDAWSPGRAVTASADRSVGRKSVDVVERTRDGRYVAVTDPRGTGLGRCVDPPPIPEEPGRRGSW